MLRKPGGQRVMAISFETISLTGERRGHVSALTSGHCAAGAANCNNTLSFTSPATRGRKDFERDE